MLGLADLDPVCTHGGLHSGDRHFGDPGARAPRFGSGHALGVDSVGSRCSGYKIWIWSALTGSLHSEGGHFGDLGARATGFGSGYAFTGGLLPERRCF